MAEEPLQARMSLSEHLGELRTRLLRCVIAVLVLGAAGLVFARPIFAFLMRPVLDALPATDRSLIYTSGIEELNVLMKVGLHAGHPRPDLGIRRPRPLSARAPLRLSLHPPRHGGVPARRCLLLPGAPPH